MELLSIVIPTRNREKYCISAIKQILEYESESFEIVICDNSDSDEIENHLSAINDSRVVYRHVKERVNSVINVDGAMRMASGEYVCMIGDDDTILPSIFDVVKWAKLNDFDNVTPLNMITYFWPDGNEQSGTISWDVYNDSRFQIKNCEAQLNKFVRDGCIRYYEYLPRVYHGLIKRIALEKVMSKTSHIVGGLSPDIYMAITVACICESFIVIEKPFTIAGACPSSYTSRDNTGRNSFSIDENPQLYRRGPYTWDNRIPRVKTSQTIWAETAIKALEEMHRFDLITHFNQGCLFAEMLRYNAKHKHILYPTIKKTKLVTSKLTVIFGYIGYYVAKSFNKFFRSKLQKINICNIQDMDVAIYTYNEYYK